MIIALDYDRTYTKAPELWNTFIPITLRQGHQIILVTMRSAEEMGEVTTTLGNIIPIYHTSRGAKSSYLAHKGIYPDVWIDDNPVTIYADHYNRINYVGRD